VNTLDPSPDDPELEKFMDWADPYRTMKVRANAASPAMPFRREPFGAEALALPYREHVLGEQKFRTLRAMILADNEKDAARRSRNCCCHAAQGFRRRIQAMDGIPGYHSHARPAAARVFAAPRRSDGGYRDAPYADAKEKKSLVSKVCATTERRRFTDLKKLMPMLLSRVEQLHEFNPMLGHRGLPLGITYPRLRKCRRAPSLKRLIAVPRTASSLSEVDDPAHRHGDEMANQAAIVNRVAKEVFKEKGTAPSSTLVGTMIELPRAALDRRLRCEGSQFFSSRP